MRVFRGYAKILSILWLCAGHARLLAGALRERTKFQIRVKRKAKRGTNQEQVQSQVDNAEVQRHGRDSYRKGGLKPSYAKASEGLREAGWPTCPP